MSSGEIQLPRRYVGINRRQIDKDSEAPGVTMNAALARTRDPELAKALTRARDARG